MAQTSLARRLRPLKALLLDVDGVLTDAKTWYAGDGKWRRQFCMRDGYGIKKLLDHGFTVGIITASNAEDIRARAEVLKIPHLYQGSLDKVTQFEKFLRVSGLKESEIAYVGDDEPDLPLLERVGFAASVPGAIAPARKVAHYVTKQSGGNGAVREICDMIFASASVLAQYNARSASAGKGSTAKSRAMSGRTQSRAKSERRRK